ncbi:MAG: deacylase [Candidatus Hecatellales archaeon B24]|nr:MAG: deacylase [Candidatus Hecatellales archaeon B24]
MKAGLAALTLAFLRLRKIRGLKGSLMLALTSDEELYSRGCERLISLGLLKGVDASLSAEPTGLKRLEAGRRGRVVFRVEFPRGKANPVVKAASFIMALEGMHLKRGARISAMAVESWLDADGSPGLCRVAVDRLMVPSETFEGVLAEVGRVAGRFHGKASFHPRPTPYMQPYRLKAGEPIVKALREACHEILGFKPKLTLGPTAGDENYLAVRCGIPTVAYGPEGGNIHRPGEYVELESVVRAANVYVAASIKFLSSRLG